MKLKLTKHFTKIGNDPVLLNPTEGEIKTVLLFLREKHRARPVTVTSKENVVTGFVGDLKDATFTIKTDEGAKLKYYKSVTEIKLEKQI